MTSFYCTSIFTEFSQYGTYNSWPLSVLTHQMCTGTLMVNISRQCKYNASVQVTVTNLYLSVGPSNLPNSNPVSYANIIRIFLIFGLFLSMIQRLNKT